VIDLDGTVVPYFHEFAEPSPRVVKAVAATLAAGVPVVVATGRPIWSTLPTTASLGLDGTVVASNGAVLYDVAAGALVHEVKIDPRPVALALAEVAPDAGFAVEHGTEGYLYTAGFARDFPSAFVREAPFEEVLAAPTTRLICRLPREQTDPATGRCPEAAAVAATANYDREQYFCEVGYSGWIDVSAHGITKAAGVALLARELGVDAADAAAIGDGHNDLPMFAWAGHAVAMGQAPLDVQAAADEVTASVLDDGVAVTLERWFA